MTQYIQAILTMLSLVNPLICVAIFANATQGQSRHEKIVSATKAALAIVVILSLAALGGAQLLNAFGISMSAFQVAGGMVLVWMGFIMLHGGSSPTSTATDSQAQPSNASLTPLILFAASPGTITGVITLSVAHAGGELPTTALVAVIVAIGITWLIMVLTTKQSSDRKKGLVQDVTSRFMGLIVLAMGVQFVLTGLKDFFPFQ